MALHEYNVQARGRNTVATTMLLSDEDAEAMGLTSKDRVSAKAVSTGIDDEFKPATEADLDPYAKENAEERVRAAEAEQARVAAEQEAAVEAAKAEAKRVADEQKQASAPANKQAPKSANK